MTPFNARRQGEFRDATHRDRVPGIMSPTFKCACCKRIGRPVIGRKRQPSGKWHCAACVSEAND